jgi:peptidyl-prolyl cis-trans isomerase C
VLCRISSPERIIVKNLSFTTVTATALLLALLAGACKKDETTAAAAPATADDPVVMTVNGEDVRQSVFAAALQAVPDQMKQMVETEPGRKAVARELVRMKVLEQEAKALKLDQDPAISARLELERANILASAAVEKLLEGADDARLMQIYEKNKQEFESVSGSQIIVAYEGGMVPPKSGAPLSDDRARARAAQLAQRIRSGESFEKVAAAESDDTQSAARGGDFGELARSEVPPEIGRPLFALEPGQVSDPVKSRFGYHIFKVNEKRSRQFEEVKPILQGQGRGFVAQQLVEEKTAAANVEFNKAFFPTSPMEDSAAPPPAQPQTAPPQQ